MIFCIFLYDTRLESYEVPNAVDSEIKVTRTGQQKFGQFFRILRPLTNAWVKLRGLADRYLDSRENLE